jgi:predicted nucleic acid-binding Zn ribbon protein
VRPVSRAVGRLLRGLGIATEVARAGAIDQWAPVARGVLGADADVTRAIAVDGTTLIVTVPTSAWSSEIRLREAVLLDRLLAAAPASGIRAIRTVMTAGRGT